MNFTKTFSTTAPHGDSGILETNLFLRLFQYFVAAGLGIIGGGLGVVLMLGLLLAWELAGSTGQTLAPGTFLMAIAASGLGLGAAWLLTGAVRRINSIRTFQRLDRNCLQVSLLFSVLTAFLEISFYLHNLSI